LETPPHAASVSPVVVADRAYLDRQRDRGGEALRPCLRGGSVLVAISPQ
jgi:hypothetical protein